MDGSGYRPHREDPQDHDDAGDDRLSLLLLAALALLAAGTLFYLDRLETRNFADCLLGKGVACDAYKAIPVPGYPEQSPDE